MRFIFDSAQSAFVFEAPLDGVEHTFAKTVDDPAFMGGK
jgi:hypothetical protein